MTDNAGLVEQLRAQITEQGDRVRELKAQKAEKEALDSEVGQLLALKEKLRIATGAPKKEKEKAFTLKTPKGTKDYSAKEMSVRSDIFRKIVGVFERHGAVTIDTPVFELKEILTGKYGEDSKLIYDLKDQGGEECSLRYDLTVPFARYVAMNGIQAIKRYQIAKVYRRDQPAMTKGRMREFYQCDLDIAGAYDPMIPDAECVRVAVEILGQLDVGPFVIKVNHRKILDAVFEVCGVEEAKIRTISSAVDKLDKQPWAEVRREMTDEKGLDGAVADRIGEYVQLSGGPELVEKLRADAGLMRNERARQGVDDMALFFRYVDIYGVADRVSFDMSLARGLDYYTGLIYEAVLVEENDGPVGGEVRVGSIAAGGRYDALVGMFQAARRGGKRNDVPCVGISFGVERIFSLVMSRQKHEVKPNRTQVFVMAMRDGLLEERMRIATELWDAGIAAEFLYKEKPRMQAQFNACDRDIIPWAVTVGQEELARGKVLLKSMDHKIEGQDRGVEIDRASMVAELKQRLQI